MMNWPVMWRSEGKVSTDRLSDLTICLNLCLVRTQVDAPIVIRSHPSQDSGICSKTTMQWSHSSCGVLCPNTGWTFCGWSASRGWLSVGNIRKWLL
eukprot:5270640-Amphidinium_carterae.1